LIHFYKRYLRNGTCLGFRNPAVGMKRIESNGV